MNYPATGYQNSLSDPGSHGERQTQRRQGRLRLVAGNARSAERNNDL